MKKIILLILCLLGLFLLFAPFLFAANEIRFAYDSSSDPNLYVIIGRITDANVWDVNNTEWADWANANEPNYALAMSLVRKDFYDATFPTGITTAGIYPLTVYKQASTDPNITDDLVVGEAEIAWDGETEVADIRSSVHTWYVTKHGSNSNDGHSPATAYLTISQAVTDANNGDTIIIYPGDYDETVDCDTANFSGTLEGTDRHKSRIARTGAGEDGIILEDNVTIKNLAISTTSKSGNVYGIYGSGKDNIVIEDCEILGALDAINVNGCRVFIENSNLTGYYDVINNHGATGLVVANNCSLYTDGTHANDTPARCLFFNNGSLTFLNNCTLTVARTVGSTSWAAGVEDIATLGGATAVVNNCVIEVSTAGSGDVYSLRKRDADSYIYVANSYYDTSITDGTIIDRSEEIIADINDVPTKEENRDAVFGKTGITAGGTWTFAEIVKYNTAWLLGNWQDKSGEAGTYEIMDGEDPNTVILEYIPSATSPQKEVTLP